MMAQLLQRHLSSKTPKLVRLFSLSDSRKGIAERVPVESARFQREAEIEESDETGLLQMENQLQNEGPKFLKHHNQEAREQDDLSGLGETENRIEDEALNHPPQNYVMLRDQLMEQKQYERLLQKHNDQDSRLVKRPTKDFLWGYGTKVFNESKEGFFRKGELPSIKELIRFCEAYQMADIQVVNIKLGPRQQFENFALICSGYSSRHIYHTAKNLVKELKRLECKQIVNTPRVAGRKEDLWVLVVAKEVQVHFILEEYRDILELEYKFLNRIDPAELEDWKFWAATPKRKPDYPIHNTGPSTKEERSRAERRAFRKKKQEEELAKDGVIKERTEDDIVFEMLAKERKGEALDSEEEDVKDRLSLAEEELTLADLLLKKKVQKRLAEEAKNS